MGRDVHFGANTGASGGGGHSQTVIPIRGGNDSIGSLLWCERENLVGSATQLE